MKNILILAGIVAVIYFAGTGYQKYQTQEALDHATKRVDGMLGYMKSRELADQQAAASWFINATARGMVSEGDFDRFVAFWDQYGVRLGELKSHKVVSSEIIEGSNKANLVVKVVAEVDGKRIPFRVSKGEVLSVIE